MPPRKQFKPFAGQVLTDAEHPQRVVRLVTRIDPHGKDVKPYWTVKNLQSGEETTVLESEIPRRYNVPPARGEVVPQAPDAQPERPRTAPDADTLITTDEPTA